MRQCPSDLPPVSPYARATPTIRHLTAANGRNFASASVWAMGARVGTRRPSGVRRVSDVCFRFNRMASRVEPACRRCAWRPSVDSRSLLTRAMVYGMYCNMYGRLLARPPDVNVVGACRSSSSPRPTAPMSWEFIMTMGTWFLLLTSTQRRFFYVSPLLGRNICDEDSRKPPSGAVGGASSDVDGLGGRKYCVACMGHVLAP